MEGSERIKTSAACPGLLILILLIACKTEKNSDLTGESLIPYPVMAESTGEYFRLDKWTVNYVNDLSREIKQTAMYFANRLKPVTGADVSVVTSSKTETGFHGTTHPETLSNKKNINQKERTYEIEN